MTLPSEEHIFQYPGQGRIEVICGSMFSGKTEPSIKMILSFFKIYLLDGIGIFFAIAPVIVLTR